jgi:hypothetical protein
MVCDNWVCIGYSLDWEIWVFVGLGNGECGSELGWVSSGFGYGACTWFGVRIGCCCQ